MHSYFGKYSYVLGMAICGQSYLSSSSQNVNFMILCSLLQMHPTISIINKLNKSNEVIYNLILLRSSRRIEVMPNDFGLSNVF